LDFGLDHAHSLAQTSVLHAPSDWRLKANLADLLTQNISTGFRDDLAFPPPTNSSKSP